MRGLLLAMFLALGVAGCSEVQLQRAETGAGMFARGAEVGAEVAGNPAVVAATGGASLPIAELLAALAAAGWATERFFSWRLKLKSKAPVKK